MSGSAPIGDALRIEPPAGEWPALVASHRSGMTEQKRAFRAQLNLPADRPVIMSGHQAEFWHPGILAKWLATVSAAEITTAGAAWIVVDQDVNDLLAIRYPRIEAPGRPAPGVWNAADPEAPRGLPDTPTGERAAHRPPPLPEAAFATPSVAAGLEMIRGALSARVSEASAARQVGSATADLLAPLGGPVTLVYASQLARTSLMRDLVSRMRSDPRRCADEYNRAVARHSEAGIAMLSTSGGLAATHGPELPLWRITPGKGRPRERVFASMLGSTPDEHLAPRALLMTGLLRLAGCDLFIHGTGGGGETGYDRIAESWLRSWLGEPAADLAPSALVTATRRLDMGIEPASPAEAAHAVWLAHHARHHPSLLGEPGLESRKRDLLAKITAARSRGEHPREAFRAMHDLLHAARFQHADDLGRLDQTAADLRARLAATDVINDRTWPFPLYPSEVLRDLAASISDRFRR
ncbi:MAG: hypothetical protein KF745_12410 [Phycisphaeraceae bacterium]|nr:hypothetical protein [Phycisphaeraceae bacterium]